MIDGRISFYFKSIRMPDTDLEFFLQKRIFRDSLRVLETCVFLRYTLRTYGMDILHEICHHLSDNSTKSNYRINILVPLNHCIVAKLQSRNNAFHCRVLKGCEVSYV